MNKETAKPALDTGYLEASLLEIELVADTHFTPGEMRGSEEFPSRGVQQERSELVMQYLGGADWTLHLGDLVQSYPEMPGFKESFKDGMETLKLLGRKVHLVAGNHDVGDKPDGTMPTHPVSREALDWYHEQTGQSWYRLERDGIECLVINSQILNTGLKEAETQQAWLEKALKESSARRKLLFFHLPLYLGDEDEPALGHYDVIAEPARSWLLQLIRDYGIELCGGAHVHFSFFDRIGDCRYFQFASPAFTRPGFGHLFTAGAPSEQGRNDRAKLGFYRLRVLPERMDVHFIRTYGDPGRTRHLERGYRMMIPRTSAGLPNSPLGVNMTQALSNCAEVPLTFPSMIRHTVRNDYPFLLLQELGVRHLRVPDGDMAKPLQRDRLSMLSREGVQIHLTGFDPDILLERWKTAVETLPISRVEWLLAGVDEPDREGLEALQSTLEASGTELILCPVVPGTSVAGKQHPRTRVGYDLEGIKRLTAAADARQPVVERVHFRIPDGASPLATVGELTRLPAETRPAIDLALTLDSLDDASNLRRGVEGLLAVSALPGSRLFLDPLIDLDRTMDVMNGLLDGLCNPRPIFEVLRTLNTLLFSRPENLCIRNYDTNCGLYELESTDTVIRIDTADTPETPAVWMEGWGAVPRWELILLQDGLRFMGTRDEVLEAFQPDDGAPCAYYLKPHQEHT